MMKFSRNAVVLVCSASLFLASCGGGNSQNPLYYNNYTHADTEGYVFLKTVANEAQFQQISSGEIGNSTLASEIKTTYAAIAQELHELSDQQHVLSPIFSDKVHETDSTASGVDLLVHSQEIIVGQFGQVLHNTNTHIADYARKTLPKVEELLAKTKAAK